MWLKNIWKLATQICHCCTLEDQVQECWKPSTYTQTKNTGRYICSAVKKLLALDFAKLSLFELWLCDGIWKSASIPAPAIQILQLFRKHLLSAVFLMELLCPDHRCIDIITDTKDE